MAKVEDLIPLLNLENASAAKGDLKASCPLAKWTHKNGTDSKPSFGINYKNGVYMYGCRACGHSGLLPDLFTELYVRTKNFDYLSNMEFLEKLEGAFGDYVYEAINDWYLNEEYHRDILPPVTDYKVALDYCLTRGISAKTCDRLKLTYHPEMKRVVFTIYSYSGKLLGHTGRSINPKADLKILTTANPTIKRTLLGIHKLDRNKPILVVEGLFMYAKLHEYNLDDKYNILATMGTGVSSHQRELLVSFGLPVYLMLDNDESGRNATYVGTKKTPALKELALYVPVLILQYPQGIEDPDLLTEAQICDMIRNAELVQIKRRN